MTGCQVGKNSRPGREGKNFEGKKINLGISTQEMKWQNKQNTSDL